LVDLGASELVQQRNENVYVAGVYVCPPVTGGDHVERHGGLRADAVYQDRVNPGGDDLLPPGCLAPGLGKASGRYSSGPLDPVPVVAGNSGEAKLAVWVLDE